nr:MAG TPA: hypothetical protein [Caudoviricetes sp.]
MQKEGILPPDKARLNRKKFAREVMAEFGAMDVFAADLYLRRAIGCMVSEDMTRVSEEQVGVLKLLKIAVETQKFMRALEAEGRKQYTIGEYVDKVVHPVRKL